MLQRAKVWELGSKETWNEGVLFSSSVGSSLLLEEHGPGPRGRIRGRDERQLTGLSAGVLEQGWTLGLSLTSTSWAVCPPSSESSGPHQQTPGSSGKHLWGGRQVWFCTAGLPGWPSRPDADLLVGWR